NKKTTETIKKMKEYKVVTWKMGMTKNNERLEETLNQHAREGWVVTHIAEQSARIVFERDKNR
ncbi:MAG: DUF4177 domain-containing protein, partial [Polaribacter sp.]|nr:DUF4177 domain-containing protein [Polaribacter sp.]